MIRWRNRIFALMLCAVLLTVALPMQEARADYVLAKGDVQSDKLFLRSGPDTKYSIVDTLYRKTKLNIYEVDGFWLRVDVPETGKSGYVYGKFVGLDGKTISGYGFGVTTGKIHLREEATSKSKSLAIVPKNAALTVYYSDDFTGFYRVTVHETGMEGFVSPLYLSIVSRVDPDEPDPSDQAGYINASVVNFRTGPGTGYLVLDQLAKHTQVTVLEAGIDWYKIQVKETGISGYVFGKYVTVTNPGATPTPPPLSIPDPGAGGTINVNGVNFREGPSTSYKSLGTLNKDEYIWYNGVSGNWFKITVVATRQVGWVFSKFTTFPTPTPAPTPQPR